MRARWSEDEVRQGRRRDWILAPSEIDAIRKRSAARQIEASRYVGHEVTDR